MSTVKRASGPDTPLLEARLGNSNFTIYRCAMGYNDGSPMFLLDEGFNYRGSRLWTELPRYARSAAACKAMLTRLTGEKVKWEVAKP